MTLSHLYFLSLTLGNTGISILTISSALTSPGFLNLSLHIHKHKYHFYLYILYNHNYNFISQIPFHSSHITQHNHHTHSHTHKHKYHHHTHSPPHPPTPPPPGEGAPTQKWIYRTFCRDVLPKSVGKMTPRQGVYH